MRACIILLVAFLAVPCIAQDAVVAPQQIEVNEASTSFHRELIRAALTASKDAKSGVTRRDVIRLRVAMLSPAFAERAEELAVVQLYFNGSDLPESKDGAVDISEIKWGADEWKAFLEKLVPLVLLLLRIFGAKS